jgi:hypothetical protein
MEIPAWIQKGIGTIILHTAIEDFKTHIQKAHVAKVTTPGRWHM